MSEIERRLRLLERQASRLEYRERDRRRRAAMKLRRSSRGYLRDPVDDVVIVAHAKTKVQAERLACAKTRRDGASTRFGRGTAGWVVWDTSGLVPDDVHTIEYPRCRGRLS